MVVGDIEDEHDVASGRMILREGDTFVADARASLEEVSEALGVDLAIGELADEVDTVGGLIVTLAGRVPSRGELIAGPDQLEFEIARRRPAPGEAAAHPSPPPTALRRPRAVPKPEAPAKALATRSRRRQTRAQDVACCSLKTPRGAAGTHWTRAPARHEGTGLSRHPRLGMAARADRVLRRRRRCARDAALRHPAGACGIAHRRGLAPRRCGGGWALRRRLDARLGRRRRLVVGLRLFRRRAVVARLGVPRRGRSVRLGPAVRRARAAGAARGLSRPSASRLRAPCGRPGQGGSSLSPSA